MAASGAPSDHPGARKRSIPGSSSGRQGIKSVLRKRVACTVRPGRRQVLGSRTQSGMGTCANQRTGGLRRCSRQQQQPASVVGVHGRKFVYLVRRRKRWHEAKGRNPQQQHCQCWEIYRRRELLEPTRQLLTQVPRTNVRRVPALNAWSVLAATVVATCVVLGGCGKQAGTPAPAETQKHAGGVPAVDFPLFRTAPDLLPRRLVALLRSAPRDLDLRAAQLVGEGGGIKAWAVPGDSRLCLAEVSTGRGGLGLTCSSLSKASRNGLALALLSGPTPGDTRRRRTIVGVEPQGTSYVVATAAQTAVRLRVRGGVIFKTDSSAEAPERYSRVER
jgi:hypothetical protein